MITYAKQLPFWVRALLLSNVWPLSPLQLKPAPGAPPDPHLEANRFLAGIPTSPVA